MLQNTPTSSSASKFANDERTISKVDTILFGGSSRVNGSIARMRARLIPRFEAFNRSDGTAGVQELAAMFDINEELAQRLLVMFFDGAESITKEAFQAGVDRMYKSASHRALFDLFKDDSGVVILINGKSLDFASFEASMRSRELSKEEPVTWSGMVDAKWVGTLFNETLKRMENGKIHFKREEKMKQNGKCGDLLYAAYLHRRDVFWAVLLAAITIFTFLYGFFFVYNEPGPMAVMGLCVCFAHGSAVSINWLMIVVLLAMARSFWTYLRGIKNGVMLNVIPIDSLIHLHKIAGIVILLWTVVHVCAHICNFYRIGLASPEELSVAFNTNITEPMTTAYMWTGSIPGTTGIAMLAIFAVAYPFTLPYWRKTGWFNVFWTTHHLLLVYCVILAAHGTQQLLGPFTSVYFMVGPLALYLLDRAYRVYGSLSNATLAPVVSITMVRDHVVRLELQKPQGKTALSKNRWNSWVPGGYSFINIPDISFTEWHPFSMTSAPQDKTITFHIQVVGDWTNTLRGLAAASAKQVHLDGPYGAPSQRYLNFKVAVFVAGGIGVTPYSSILSSLQDRSRRYKLEKVVLVWIVRSKEDLDWMSELLLSVISECEGMVEIVRFVTDKNYTKKIEEQPGMLTIYGKRPDLDYVLASAQAAAVQFEKQCGVFFTGNPKLGDELKHTCIRLSQNSEKATGDRFDFVFHREVF